MMESSDEDEQDRDHERAFDGPNGGDLTDIDRRDLVDAGCREFEASAIERGYPRGEELIEQTDDDERGECEQRMGQSRLVIRRGGLVQVAFAVSLTVPTALFSTEFEVHHTGDEDPDCSNDTKPGSGPSI